MQSWVPETSQSFRESTTSIRHRHHHHSTSSSSKRRKETCWDSCVLDAITPHWAHQKGRNFFLFFIFFFLYSQPRALFFIHGSIRRTFFEKKKNHDDCQNVSFYRTVSPWNHLSRYIRWWMSHLFHSFVASWICEIANEIWWIVSLSYQVVFSNFIADPRRYILPFLAAIDLENEISLLWLCKCVNVLVVNQWEMRSFFLWG